MFSNQAARPPSTTVKCSHERNVSVSTSTVIIPVMPSCYLSTTCNRTCRSGGVVVTISTPAGRVVASVLWSGVRSCVQRQ